MKRNKEKINRQTQQISGNYTLKMGNSKDEKHNN